jgi:glycosyltransferase involved in cell wall biosynthesis
MVHTLHIVPDENTSRLWTLWPQARVTAVSKHQWSEFPDLKPTAIVPHGVDLSGFTFHEKPDDYLCYLGRFVSGKGPIQAIETARELGMRLRLAGPENAYFRKHVAPLVDGRQIEYIGFVEGAARDRFLGGGRALLYPIQYPEAFGLVLVEAMLCGTPVAAMNLGAVPELVQEGLNGGLANSMAEFPAAVRRCLPLDRRAIRQTAEERYSAERMAREYLRLYEEVVASSKL